MNDSHTLERVQIERIMELLPHRYPFLLVDRVKDYQLEPEKRLTAVKNVSIGEPYFQGHFPGHPVMPGVLIIEAMAQAAGVLTHLAHSTNGEEGAIYYLVKIDNARFNQIVTPGDQLCIEVEERRMVRSMGLYACRATVDGKKVASAELLCAAKREKK